MTPGLPGAPCFGVVIIGDELLSGKRQDKHLPHAIGALSERGLALSWCHLIGDDSVLITETLRHVMQGGDIAFSFGGIGATPDDHTRQCAAAAAGVPLIRHPEAVAEIEARFGAAAYPHRILMADLPAGSRIIPNPYNRIPGFSLGDVHFLPGFPQMAWPMMDWVLDEQYRDLQGRERAVERIIVAVGAYESQLLTVMEEIVRDYPEVRLSCLPHLSEAAAPTIEFGLRGEQPVVEEAMTRLQQAIVAAGFQWRELN